MKNQILNYIFYGIFILILSSCVERTEKKNNDGIQNSTELNTEVNEEKQSEFVYSKADKKVELILENDAEFLVVGKPTRANFPTENINNQRFMISGPGIMVNRADKDGFRFTITPIKETLIDGNLEINVAENIENGENFTHKFLVPVKETAEKN